VLLLGGLLLVTILLEFLKFILWRAPRNMARQLPNKATPLVSIHLAIYNEPAPMVITTIKHILNQDYRNYELIVIDNNTTDATLWKPVADFCKAHDKVRFFHLSNWPFYKSGALNFARKVTAPKASHIFILDADYTLNATAIGTAISSIGHRKIALIQFPQSYRYTTLEQLPILEEFNHFFNFYCTMANKCYGALATGTLSLITITALDAVGGWPTNSITEDAELGSRLQSAGYHIKFDNRIIGTGIAPIHQQDFYEQRKRWIFGNIQSLSRYAVSPFRPFHKWTSAVSQLTAWTNLLGFPLLCLVGCLLLFPFIATPTLHGIYTLSYASLWVCSIAKYSQVLLVQKNKPLVALHTFLVHFSSLSIAAFYWWPVVLGHKKPFIKTNKATRNATYTVNLFYPVLHLSLLFFGLFFNDFFLSVSGISFFIIHLLSSYFDCSFRNKHFKNISLSLKIIS